MTNSTTPSAERSRSAAMQLQRATTSFQIPTPWRSIWQIATSLTGFVASWTLAYLLIDLSFWLALVPILLTSGFLVKLFIIFHDCGHQSFFRSARANNFWGHLTGLFTMTPYRLWTSEHARHHATSANLDKRWIGDIWMMTVDEYNAASKALRFGYRLYRHPIVMFSLGPLLLLIVTQRFVGLSRKSGEFWGVYLTDLGIIGLFAAGYFFFDWKNFLIVQMLSVYIAFAAGIWLFYVQHQFEGAYWARNDEWDFVTASMDGGSFYDLPVILRWFTGNIGFHHVHHLNSRIPNYNLLGCHRHVSDMHETKPITLFQSLKSLRYRLYDEKNNRLVGFKDASRPAA
jgi:omega-6 fatty acid desaturase (delta-12 desaturase)